MIRKNDTELWSAPVWVDFNARDGRSRVPLDYPGTLKDLDRHAIDLREGQRLVLYTYDAGDAGDDDLVCLGTVGWDAQAHRWYAIFDWKELLHVSELDPADRGLYRSYRPQA